MDTAAIDKALEDSLEDGRLSRSEKRAITGVLEDQISDIGQLDVWRSRAFRMLRERGQATNENELRWLEEVLKTLRHVERQRTQTRSSPSVAHVHFSPGERCLHELRTRLDTARTSIDICVFTITDNRLAESITAAHDRGVPVRVISDNDKSYDRGSDIEKLTERGIATRVDRSEHHMHHKFAVFDGRILVNGSYNWTRSAAAYNRENILVTDEDELVTPFRDLFEDLWKQLG